jgi:uncharacterized SAM-binding protein YcdF (DUF218 family)
MRTIIGLIVGFIIIVVALTVYLGPNDLAGCGAKPSNKKGCEAADAIVAISGGDTVSRTREAISLYQNGWGKKLVFSGAAQDKSGPSNAKVMRREALAAGVAKKDILIEEYGETTKENAVKTQTIFEANDIKSVIVVTSAYHQRRAGLEFKKRSNGMVDVRNHPVASDDQWSVYWWATPVGWFLAIGEFVKIIAFYTAGTR